MQIGSLKLDNPVFLAPMDGITDLAFRLIAKQYGCALVYSEMVSCHGLVHNFEVNRRYLLSHADEKPLAVQLFGADADIMAKAAQICVCSGADLIDINMGCPVKKVVRTGAGSALMRTPKLVEEIVTKIRRVINIPLTVKIRTGWYSEHINAVKIAKIAADAGADAVCIHGRTRMQGFSGCADWEIIAKVKFALDCIVIGNGDIKTAYDAKRMMEQTGCDCLMIGRAARGNPWIFAQIIKYLKNGELPPPAGLAERKAVLLKQFELLNKYYGSHISLLHIRKHLIWYTQSLPYSARLRRLIAHLDTKEKLIQAVNEYWVYLEETVAK